MTVFLVRHGSAGHRDDSDPSDDLRPLDERGRRQADDLVELLADRRVVAVGSSPATRCVETVAPLARVRGIDVEIAVELFEGADVDAAWALVDAAARPWG